MGNLGTRFRSAAPRRSKKRRSEIVGQPDPSSSILVVDDDPDPSLVAQLERAGHAILAVETGEEALEVAFREAPALAVVEVCLSGICGYEVCRQLKTRYGDGLPIVLMSAERTESYDRVAGLLVGADECLAKPVAPDELLIRIERLLARGRPVAPPVATKLTVRELEVLSLLAEGLAASEIAERLFISPKTVSTHIDRIRRKLDLHSRAQLVAVAHRMDLFPAPS